MVILTRLTKAARALLSPARPARRPELWCRPATVLVLRDRSRPGRCLAGWR